MATAKPAGAARSASDTDPSRSTRTGKIEPADLSAKFHELKDDVEDTTEEVKGYAATVATAVVVVVVIVAFVWGRQRGKRSKAVVEIRRY